MAIVIQRDALDKASAAVYSAMRQCRDLDGAAVDQPKLSDDDLAFAVLGIMTMLMRDEVLQEIVLPRPWPPCLAAKREFGE